MKNRKLTTSDLLKRQHESEGYGLYGHEVRSPVFWCERSEDPYLAARAVDESTVRVANCLQLDADGLFHFMNSKLGRWAGDEIANSATKNQNGQTEAVLEKYMRQFFAQKS